MWRLLPSRVGFKPMAIRTQGTELTTEPPRPTMITSTVSTDDNKLLQELNFTAQQPRRAPNTLCIKVYQRLAKEGLRNLTDSFLIVSPCLLRLILYNLFHPC